MAKFPNIKKATITQLRLKIAIDEIEIRDLQNNIKKYKEELKLRK
jgi:hypothetical protein